MQGRMRSLQLPRPAGHLHRVWFPLPPGAGQRDTCTASGSPCLLVRATCTASGSPCLLVRARIPVNPEVAQLWTSLPSLILVIVLD